MKVHTFLIELTLAAAELFFVSSSQSRSKFIDGTVEITGARHLAQEYFMSSGKIQCLRNKSYHPNSKQNNMPCSRLILAWR